MSTLPTIITTLPADTVTVRITAREKECLAMVCEGLTDKEIMARMHLSHRGARFHLESLYIKSGANNRVMLAVWALRNGLVK